MSPTCYKHFLNSRRSSFRLPSGTLPAHPSQPWLFSDATLTNLPYNIVHLYSFFPIFPQAVFAENTEVGKLYELVVTNLSGLYRYRIGDVVKIARFHNNCPVIEYQYRQGQILNVRAEKTSERAFYDALTSALSDQGQRLPFVDYTCAESILFDGDESHVIRGDDVKGAAPFYVVFLELSGGGLGDEERKNLETKVRYLSFILVATVARLL